MKHKVTIITGANRGLGKSAALHLADLGSDIIFTYHSHQDEAEAVKRELESKDRKVAFFKLDSSKPSEFEAFSQNVKSTLEKWGRKGFDGLLNNAGIGLYKPILETTEEDLDRMYAIHFKGPYLLTKTLLPFMNDGGRILNVSSGLARFSYPGSSAYASMKGAIDVFTRYLAKELGERRITVNSIAPGAIATDFGGGRVRDNQEINDMISSQTALGRVGEADDIGGVMAEMLMGPTNWINGQRIEASGGIHL